ncbi:MAG: cell division topological specificity factor MinE [Buchnera aphidicola (Nurudea shiraii)]
MALINFFLSQKKHTSKIAKERLQIIVAERRKKNHEPNYLPELKKEIFRVICKYVKIDPKMISVQLDHKEKDISILELNVIIPD